MDTEQAEWGIGIAYDPGPRIWRWLFNRPAPNALMPLCHAVDDVLQANPEFAHSVEWWHEAHEGESTPHNVGRPKRIRGSISSPVVH